MRYEKGKFLNAMNPASAERNEQNVVTVRGQGADAGFEVTFKQIAGLLARRIVFRCGEGQTVERGQRVGLIKFGSRVDVVLPADARAASQGGRAGEGRRQRAGRAAAPREDQPAATPAMPQRRARVNHHSMPPRPKPEHRRVCAAACTCCLRCLPPATWRWATSPSRRPSTPSRSDAPMHLDWAAIAILFAIPFDALDGRIARMTNTASDFGKELDSLADVITFGVAPSLLAFVWGFHFLPDSINPQLRQHLVQAGGFICFLFLLSGASRLARFNISHDAQPRNPGRPDRKYFVGMPIPAAAGLLAATVHLCYGIPNP